MKKIYFLIFILLVSNLSYGQTLIVGQDFDDVTTWAFSTDPIPYVESGDKDIWASVTTLGSSNNGLDAAQNGVNFWGMRDLDNPYVSTSTDSVPPGLGLTNPYNHTLVFSNVEITGKSDVEVSFYYNAYSLNNGYLKVEFFLDNVSQGEEIVFSDADGTATDGWEKYIKEIAAGSDSLKMTIHAYNDQDYLAMDNVKLEADVPERCPITLGETTAICDALTDDVDTYTATLAYSGAGGETYTVTATSGTVGGDDPSTVEAGTITVSGVTEGVDVTINITGGICNENSVITAPICESEVVLPTLPIEETFSYEVGTNLSDNDNWEDLFSGDTITVSEGSLSYDGLKAPAGNSVTFSENGLDANMAFNGVTEGAVYASLLFKVSDLSTLTKGGYFVVLGNDYKARLWLNPDGDQFNVGVSVGSKLNVIDTVKLNVDDVVFVVMNYDFADSTCNVWVNPSVDDFEADSAPTPTITDGGGTMEEIGRIMLRQDSNSETPTMTVDEMKIGTTWASVTPKDAPVATGNDWNFSDEQFVALEGDITETTTVSGLTMYATADSKLTVGPSASTIGDMTYTHRLKSNGSGKLDENNMPASRVLSFEVTGNTLISIALTSANSSSDRLLNIAADSANNVVAQLTATGGVKDVQEYTYSGEATTIYVYSDNSGINLYQITAKAVPTGIKQISNVVDVNVYPNPASDRVFVDVNQPTQVAIYNVAGSLMKLQMVQSRSEAIDISELKEGLYIIRSHGSNLFAKKLIVK